MNVHFFVPYCVDQDGSLISSYDSVEYKNQVDGWFRALGLPWHWQPITHASLEDVIRQLERLRAQQELVVFNACDGVDVDGFPGLSVVRALEHTELPFTGASSAFYEVTTSKPVMKRQLAACGVSTAPFVEIADVDRDIRIAARCLGYPFILKPTVSAGSAGITDRSVVHNEEAAILQARRILSARPDTLNYHEGLFAEAFLGGREFTVFIVAGDGQSTHVFPPAQRVFHSSLPRERRLLSHDRYWERYQEEEPLPNGAAFYWYAAVPEDMSRGLSELAHRAFRALNGTGYARVDIREDDSTGELQVLEVNSNCGITSDDQTSVGRILMLNGIAMSDVIGQILADALSR